LGYSFHSSNRLYVTLLCFPDFPIYSLPFSSSGRLLEAVPRIGNEVLRPANGLFCKRREVIFVAERMKIIRAVTLLLSIMMGLSLANNVSADSQGERPEKWAQPIQMKGVPNLHKVSDRLYRSAQPTAEGMRNLKKMGVQTIVSLRSFHTDRDEIGNTGLAYEHIYMKAWHPEEEEIVRFLQIVTRPERSPVLVHCQHGADRTGTMCAVYRIAIQGWTKEEAVKEMIEGGFGFHGVFANIAPWINRLDIGQIKRKAGIE
jgi:protein tyrosine phosphatase (PTP) superfamily phosphohydrolase (DUF442 family)